MSDSSITSDSKLEFTVNEQNCLAELCTIIVTQGYFYNKQYADSFTREHYEEFSKKTIKKLERLFECFPSINWGELYDKFHRQGKNNV